jgi:hypothetical protein
MGAQHMQSGNQAASQLRLSSARAMAAAAAVSNICRARPGCGLASMHLPGIPHRDQARQQLF